MSFIVTASHVHADYNSIMQGAAFSPDYHSDCRISGDDENGYYAKARLLGCGKTCRTAEAAIHSLLADNGYNNIRIEAAPEPEPETTINLDYARKAEGIYYGDGSAVLAERIARAASKLTSPKGRANAAYEAIRAFAAETGCNPDRECFMREEDGGWRVSFEAGPYSWAMVASEALCQCGIFAEPYYSFDLCFYPE